MLVFYCVCLALHNGSQNNGVRSIGDFLVVVYLIFVPDPDALSCDMLHAFVVCGCLSYNGPFSDRVG